MYSQEKKEENRRKKGGKREEELGVLYIRSAILTNVMVAKRIRAPFLPLLASPVNVSAALTLAADPSPIQILQPTGSRAAGWRDEAAPPRTGILAGGFRRREHGGGSTGAIMVGGRVEGRPRAVRISGDET